MEKNSTFFDSVCLTRVEQSREQMHQKIDDLYDELVQKILMEEKRLTMDDGEQLLSLAADPARFKGTEAISAVIPGWQRSDCAELATSHSGNPAGMQQRPD